MRIGVQSRPLVALSLAVCLAMGTAQHSEAAEPRRWVLGSEHLRVLCWPQHEELGELALEEGGDALRRLRRMLDVELDERIDVFIVRSQREFDELAGGDSGYWVVGRALPRNLRVVLKPVGPQRLPKLLAHELAHVMLDVRMGEAADELPRWLHEGIAQYAAGDFEHSQKRVIAGAALRGKLLRIDELNAAFHGDQDQVALAYAQSYTLVDYLGTLEPAKGLAPLLEQLEKGRDVRLALGLAYGRPVPAMEEEWLEIIGRAYATALAPPLGQTIIGALFVIAFIITLVAVRRRSARIRRRMEAEERLQQLLREASVGGVTGLPETAGGLQDDDGQAGGANGLSEQ
ncbi:MAG: peptidase MA family metallohydrolase [Armatimonadota bacterium]|nr:peptidase MA family metallohydrolase [Armatimonadota bacterium]